MASSEDEVGMNIFWLLHGFINNCFIFDKRHHFTALHAIQTRSSDENFVCPCIRPSVKRVHFDKTEERSVHIFIHTKDHSAEFFEKKNGWWGRPFLPEMLRQPVPVGAKSPIFTRYSLVAPQP